jgi:branched-chain amino acid transport system substrate-binding protein
MRKEEPGVSVNLPWFSKNAAALGAVALSFGVLAACSSNSSSSTSTSTSTSTSSAAGSASASSSGTITIGASLSLSGDFATDGNAFDKGYLLWEHDVNASGGIMGRQVSIKILDDGSSPNQAVTNYQTLIATDHVDLIFGPYSSLITGPASAVASRYGYAFPEGAGGAPSVFQTPQNQADHNVFDVSLPVADEMMPLVEYIKNLPASERPKSAAYPMAEDPFADPPVQLVAQQLGGLGVKSDYNKIFPAENTSYKSAADAIAAMKPDLVVLGSPDVPTVQAFMKEFEVQKYTPKLFIAAAGPDQGTGFTSAVGKTNAAAMMVPNGWYPQYNNATSKKVVAEYVAKYGGTSSGVNADVAEAYSVGEVMQQAIVATGGIENSKIIAYLHSGVTLTSMQGPVKFDSLGENGASAAFIFQWDKSGTTFNQVLPTKANGGTASVPIIAVKPAWGTAG